MPTPMPGGPTSSWSARVVFVIALLLFGLPLFIGLGRSDMENDEAIYSYSVERMLVLHDWLTPRAIYDGADNPFLEKPPLKIWMVAAGQLAGLPRDESGLRFFDPLFAILGFAYVFALGRRLAGPVCGFVGLFVLVTFQPLIFEHGVRMNNMESAMLLMYCGGIYHFFRWSEHDDSRARRRHSWAFAGYFAFGFLTKFVAACFLPAVVVPAFLWRRDAVAAVRARWRDWIWPAIGAFACIAPWFLYQTALRGLPFWSEILGHQVLTRFTSYLDPKHLQPWHYYFVRTWTGFGSPGEQWLVAIGVCWLILQAWQGRPWLARILLLWWIVPYALLSIGTSKLVHYSYPFVPPLALGAGAASAAWMEFWNAKSRPWQTRWALQYLPAAIGLALLLVALWTVEAGPLTWKIGSLRVLRTTTAARPFVLGVLALCAAGSIRLAIRVAAVVALAAALPATAYTAELRQLGEPHGPLRAIRDCALAQAASRELPRNGVYGPSWSVAGHTMFYYFRSLGPYHTAANDDDEMTRRLVQTGRQSPVILPKSRVLLESGATPGSPVPPWQWVPSIDYGAFVIALPGPYEPCQSAAVAAGGQILPFDAIRR